jgi:chromosome segregation ATPase
VYNQFNAVEIQIPPLQGEIAGLEKEIQILTRNSDSERNRIAQEKLKLTETEALIRDIQTRLKKAKEQKATLEASIAKSEDLICKNDQKVAEAREAIRKLNAEIDELQDKADSLRAKATTLEIQVERLRTDISVAEAKEDRINAEIDRNIDRINF